MNILRTFSISVAFCGKFATFGDFWKIKSFFEKPIYFFEKTPNFERFENFYNFSRILRKICYNLMKKNFTFRTSQHRFGASSIDKHRKKTHLFERKIWFSLFSIWRKIEKLNRFCDPIFWSLHVFKKCLGIFYNSFAKSKTTYGSLIHGNTAKTNSDRILNVEREVGGAIFQSKKRDYLGNILSLQKKMYSLFSSFFIWAQQSHFDRSD